MMEIIRLLKSKQVNVIKSIIFKNVQIVRSISSSAKKNSNKEVRSLNEILSSLAIYFSKLFIFCCC